MLKTLKLYEYKLPLKREFSIEGSTRKGLILESPDHGIFSEAAPLPPYSKESYRDALKELNSVLDTLLKISSEEDLFIFFKMHTLYPSVQFCIYALFQQLFHPLRYPLSFPIRHYIDIPYKDSSCCQMILKIIHTLYKAPSQTFKIKLGSYPIKAAIPLMRSILSSYPASIQLDINQKWSLEDLSLFCECFDKEAFHSIEDGVKDPKDLLLFAKQYPHPLSLDHLLRDHSIYDFLTIPSIKTCEFKPTLDMHSILDKDLMTLLHDRKINYTFSSSYESSIGIAAIGRLGVKYIPSSCLGIDTLGIFSHDIISSSFYIESNRWINDRMVIEKPLVLCHEHLTLHETATLSHR
jgi:o-succinylbenzoate synthase